uniref:Uncharacterized protein n=1 Tax=Anguilla anguilla TaxID=7936 RepID=A0A0E9XC87_ANGAN
MYLFVWGSCIFIVLYFCTSPFHFEPSVLEHMHSLPSTLDHVIVIFILCFAHTKHLLCVNLSPLSLCVFTI